MNQLTTPTQVGDMYQWRGDYFQIANAIRYHVRKSTESNLIIGCLLDMAEKQKIWMHDGTMAKNFWQWCEREVHIKRTSAQRMIKVWRVFKEYLVGMQDTILGIDFTKLALIAPQIEKMDDKEEITELIFSAESNSYRALEDNLREMNGEIATDTCPHTHLKVVTVCDDCGKTLSITRGKYEAS